MYDIETEHPLVTIVKMRNQATKNKAHPRILRNLEAQTELIASQVADRFYKTNSYFPVYESLQEKSKLELKNKS